MGGGDCRKSCSAYRLECEECDMNDLKAVYEGETGGNCYSCGLVHLAVMRKMIFHCGSTVKFNIMDKKKFNGLFAIIQNSLFETG